MSLSIVEQGRRRINKAIKAEPNNERHHNRLALWAVAVAALFLAGCTVGGSSTPPSGVVPESAPTAVVEQIPTQEQLAGRIFFYSDQDGDNEIYRILPNGTGLSQLTKNDSSDCLPAVSPDGTQVAYVSQCRDTNPAIKVVNADGTNSRTVVDTPNPDWSPEWSPDGSRIAFFSYSGGKEEIYTVKSDGTDLRRITNSTRSNTQPQWSPDGTKILYAGCTGPTHQDCQLFVVNADGTNPTQITNSRYPTEYAMHRWSPNGTKIVFLADLEASYDIFVMNEDGTNIINLSDGPNCDADANPKWSPDGKWIVWEGVLKNKCAYPVINIASADGGIHWSIDPEFVANEPSFSPDGKWIVFTRYDWNNDGGLYIARPDGSALTQISSIPAEYSSPTWVR